VFAIRFAEGAILELEALRAYDHRRVVDEIEAALTHEPGRPSRHRKRLVGVVPPWEQVRPVWELRVGEYRVYYDVDEENRQVVIRAVRRKPPDKTTKEIL